MEMLGGAMAEQGFICDFHGETCSQHWVHENEGFALNGWCGKVFGDDLNLHLSSATNRLLTVGTDEGIFGLVEHVEEALVHRQACAQEGAEDNLVLWYLDVSNCQWGLHLLGCVGEVAADFYCHDLSNSLDIAAKTHAVFLDINRTEFFQILVEQRGLLG